MIGPWWFVHLLSHLEWAMAHRLFTVCNSSGSRETTNHPSTLVTVWGQKGPFLQWISLHITPLPKFIVRTEVRGQCHGRGVLSLWWGGANSIAGLGEVVAFLRGKEVLGGMRTLLLSPTSATTNSETLLVSISIKWESQVCLWFLTSLEPWSPWESLEARTLCPRNMSMYIYTPRSTGKPWIRWSFQAIPALVLLKVLMLLWTMWKGKVHYLNSGD